MTVALARPGSLAAALEHISALSPYVTAGVVRDPSRTPEQWITTDTLLAPDGDALDHQLDRFGEEAGTGVRRIQGLFFLIGYGWTTLTPVVFAYLFGDRLPRISDRSVSVWLDGGEGGAVAFDADATVPGPVGLDRLHDEIVGHIAPLVDALHARTPLGRRALWLNVADTVAGAFEHAGEVLGDPARAEREARLLFGRRGSPLRSPRITFADFEHRGQHKTLVSRGSCCLSYQIPNSGYCMSCPLIDETERADRVRAWIDEELAQVSTPSA